MPNILYYIPYFTDLECHSSVGLTAIQPLTSRIKVQLNLYMLSYTRTNIVYTRCISVFDTCHRNPDNLK